MGYFKAKRQLFIYTLDAVREDLRHILRRYFPARDMAAIKARFRSTRLEQQQVILKLFGYLGAPLALSQFLRSGRAVKKA